jgi:hypothetical protein
MARPCSDLCMYQGAFSHSSSSRHKIKGKWCCHLCEVFREFFVWDHESRVLRPEFHCAVIPCDYWLVALLFTNSSPTWLTCHPLQVFIASFNNIPTRHAQNHTHIRILVEHETFTSSSHDMTCSDSEIQLDTLLLLGSVSGFVWVWNLVSDIKGRT